MKRKLAILVALCFVTTFPLIAQEKEDQRLKDSTKVLQEILNENNGLPRNILNQAECLLIFPHVKKVAIGIGVSYGRGALVCRQGGSMNGEWGAPAMYTLDQGSIGVQLGTTATDFVLVIMNQNGADQFLNGKTIFGSNAAATAGPTGVHAMSYDAASMDADVLTYSRSKGLFAGVSLEGASMDMDKDANKKLYGQDMSAKEIVTTVPAPPAAKPLVSLLDQTSPERKQYMSAR